MQRIFNDRKKIVSLHFIMKRLVYINCFSAILLVLSLFACTNTSKVTQCLKDIESVYTINADSAYMLLRQIKDTDNYSEHELMQYRLLKNRIKCTLRLSLDKADDIENLVEYFRNNGSVDEKVASEYILGVIYQDNGDAPQSMDCFNKCISYVEKTDERYDYLLLSRVYSQLSTLFHQEKLAQNELNALQKAEELALLGGDTLLALQYERLKISSYNLMGEIDSMLVTALRCAQGYKSRGQLSSSARARESALYPYLVKGDYKTAKDIIMQYEKESGLFDSCGNIKKGKEIYYYKKGLYYLGINKTDSARWCFYKLLEAKEKINNREAAYRGLLQTYIRTQDYDSIGKYALLYCETNDSVVQRTKSDEVSRMNAQYNYNLYKETAAKVKEEMQQGRITTFIIVAILCGVLIVLGGMAYIVLKNRKHAAEILLRNYNSKIQQLRVLEMDKESQANEIERLEKELSRMSNNLKKENLASGMQAIKEKIYEEDILSVFHKYAKDVVHASKQLSNQEWREFIKGSEELYPLFTSMLYSNDLTSLELKVALLIKNKFNDEEVCALLDSYGSSYTNCKARINMKLFKKKGAKGLRYNIYAS